MYTLLSFASAISLTVLCFVILGISIPYIEGSRKVRYARVVLAVAYFVIALPGYLELISVPVVDPLIVAAFTISAATYEALLITETLITLMCPQDINRKSIFLHLVSVSAVVMLFLLSVFVYRRFFILYLGAVFSILLYIYYIRLFNIEYKKFRTTMEEYYDEGQYYKLRWSAISFYSSLVVGLLALVAPFGPIVLYDIFTIGYITFYIMFTIRFGNYVMQLNYYLPAILSKNRVTKPDEVNADKGDRVKLNEATVGDKLKGNKEIDKLKNSLQNEGLLKMLDLEKSLVYFTTSLKSNEVVMEKTTRGKIIKLYEEDEDLLEDAIIENKQAIEMAKIYSDILSGTMDTYASIISNNLNAVMKILTSVTFILAIPTLIASIWGMNVELPFQREPLGFLIITVFSIIMCIVATIWLKRKRMLN